MATHTPPVPTTRTVARGPPGGDLAENLATLHQLLATEPQWVAAELVPWLRRIAHENLPPRAQRAVDEFLEDLR